MEDHIKTPVVPEDVADKEAYIKGYETSFTELDLRVTITDLEDFAGPVPKQIYDQNDSEKVNCEKLGWNAAIREWFDG